MQNIAQNKPTFASDYISPFTHKHAVNWNRPLYNDVRWLGRGKESWVAFDAERPYLVNQYFVHFAPHYCYPRNSSIRLIASSFVFESSDDKNSWTPRDSVTGNKECPVIRNIAPFSARYFRIRITEGPAANPNLASIWCFGVYDAPSSNTLTSLRLGNTSLLPVFSSGQANYTASVPNSTASTTVIPTASDPTAKITVNGLPVSSGGSVPVNLAVGPNVINVEVTAQTGAVQKYSITVTRADIVALSSLMVKSGPATLFPATSFQPQTLSYTVAATGKASVTVTASTAINSASTIKINTISIGSGVPTTIQLNASGNTTINIEVINGGNSTTYTLILTK